MIPHSADILSYALGPKEHWKKTLGPDARDRAVAALASILSATAAEVPVLSGDMRNGSLRALRANFPVWKRAAGWRSREPKPVKAALHELVRTIGPILRVSPGP